MKATQKHNQLGSRFSWGLWPTLVLLGLVGQLQSQTFETFNPAPDGPVYVTAVQPDGLILVGGTFATLAGQPRSCLGRLNADGTVDTAFNPTADRAVSCLTVQPDGKIVVGGSFTTICGQPRSHLARLNADGTLDSSFDPGADALVNTLAVQGDGKILVGGSFMELAGQARSHIGRLNSDGTLDTTFNPGANDTVLCLALQPDGKILVGGWFASLSGQSVTNLGRLNPNGTPDPSFNASTDNTVRTLAVQRDGKILVGGSFSAMNGRTRNNLGRLNADGTLDPTFNPAITGYYVDSLALQADGRIWVGGWFIMVNGENGGGFCRLQADGTTDAALDAQNIVHCLTVQPDGKVLVGGELTLLYGYLGRLNSAGPATQNLSQDGTTISWQRGGTSPEVWRTSFDAITEGSAWVNLGAGTRVPGGWQVTGSPLPPNATVRARGFVAGGPQDGSSWIVESSLGPLIISSQPTSRTNDAGTLAAFRVEAAASPPLAYQWYKNGTSLSDGANLSGVHRPMLLLSAVFGADAGSYSVVVTNGSGGLTSQVAILTVVEPLIVTQPQSQLTDAGQAVSFSIATAGSAPLTYQWLQGSTKLEDNTHVAGAHAPTLALTNVMGADGGDYSVVVSNLFGSTTSLAAHLTVKDPVISTQPVSQIATQSQTAMLSLVAVGTAPLSYQWRKYGADVPGATAATLPLTNVQWVDTGGYDVVVTNVYGAVTSSVASLTFPATPDAFNPGASNAVYCLALQPDGKVLVGGSFTSLGGQPRTNLGRLNADGTLDPTFNPGAPDYAVFCLAVQPDGKVLVGGGFNSLGGQARTNIGRLNGDGTLDANFNPVANSYVEALCVQGDGKTVVGGAFSSLGGQARQNIGRLNGDGTLDTSFNPAANGTVFSLALQADGGILAGGSFTMLGGTNRNYIGRVNGAGTLDTTFNPGAGNAVYSLAVQPDGKILVGGSFTTLAGTNRNHLGRLCSDGVLDKAFNPGASSYVSSLAVLADGTILAGGSFTSLGGTNRNYIGRVYRDGTLDVTFDPGANGSVYSLAVQPDGKVLVGGAFALIGGQARSRIARLNNSELATQNLAFDGSRITWSRGGGSPEVVRVNFDASTNGVDWLSLGAASYLGGAWELSGISLPPNSAVRARGLVGGGYQNGSSWFVETSVGPTAINLQPMSRTNAAWTLASFTALGAGSPPLSYHWCKDGLSLNDGGNIAGVQTSTLMLSNVLGGDMGGYSAIISNEFGAITSRVAQLIVVDPLITAQPASQLANVGQTAVFNVTTTGTEPFSCQWRKNGVALAGATGSSLTLTNVQFAEGGTYDVLVSNSYATNTSSAATLTVLDTFDPSASGPVYALAIQTDGRILVGGNFVSLGGQSRFNIGRLLASGALDPAFNPNAGGVVSALAVQPDGRILLGGTFTNLSNQTCSYLGRINADGSRDAAFNPNPSTNVNALVVQPDGKIVVGGAFTNLCGQSCRFIGRLNANCTLDTNFNASANGAVFSLALQPDGMIVAGGAFTNLCGQTRPYIGRLTADGSLDAGFSPLPNANVNCLLVQPDGKILLGGAFTSLGGQSRMYIARLDAGGSLEGAFDPAADNTVCSLALQADGKILAGGSFTTLGRQTRFFVGRINPDGTLDGTLNPGAGGPVYALALQADGGVLAGGSFTSFASQSRPRLARFSNTYPAMQGLAFDGSNITWQRGGTSPEIWRTVFEASTNGANWLSLGSEKRIPGGWQLLSNSLPLNCTVYARGWVSAGYDCSSSWLVEASSGPPAIRTQPPSQTNNSATAATFTVAAAGTLPLDCQWFRNGARLSDGGSISGAKSLSLTVSNVLGADAAKYWVVITNASGSVTSLVATLSVVDPCLSRQPDSRTNNAGTTATFTVQAAGTAQLNYQWNRGNVALDDGGKLAGTHTATLTLTSVLGADAGSYLVTISNAFGSVTSAVATLSIRDPFIASQPLSRAVSPGQSITFSVAAAGTTPAYQWRKDGVPLLGATNTALGVTNAQRLDAGIYDVVVSNTYGSVTSSAAMLTVNLVTADSLIPGANGTVNGLAVQADGKILVGGSFTTLGTQSRTNIGRLNADGSVDAAFAPGAVGNDGIYCFAAQPDGTILVGGAFLTLGGQSRHAYGQLNNDGSLNAAFSLGANGWVSCLLPLADGKTLMSGYFATVGTQSRADLARLNADGTLDPNFNPGADSSVMQVVAQPDGKILACGNFYRLGSQSREFIGRLNPDGSVDPSFNPGANGPTFCLALQPDGKIVVGGSFTTLGGQSRNHVGRLNRDGTLESTFNPGANDSVYALAIQTDGRILTAGRFTTLGGQTRNRLGRLNSDGTLDTTFNPGADNAVRTIALQADGNILVGGTFSILGGQASTNLGRLDNPDAASQTLVFDGPNLDWLRAGSAPEVWRTTFEASGDGTNWVSLGAGTRIPGGWQVTNVSIPANFTVRARGFVASAGCYNSSSWFVESQTELRPAILATGCSSNQFGASIRAVPGQVVVIEASTNLTQWTALQTNVVTSSGLIFFTDPDSSWLPHRFYRARLYEGALPPPVIGAGSGSFGFRTNRFGFSLSGVAGQNVIIESSTNLVNWTALATNSLGASPLYFTDAGGSNLPMRFYRARVP